jgi:hypothetical protein
VVEALDHAQQVAPLVAVHRGRRRPRLEPTRLRHAPAAGEAVGEHLVEDGVLDPIGGTTSRGMGHRSGRTDAPPAGVAGFTTTGDGFTYPAAWIPTTWEALEPRLRALVERPLDAAGVPQFLLDVDAHRARGGRGLRRPARAKDEDTADEAAKAAYLASSTEVLPRLEPIGDQLNRKLLAVPDYRPPAALAPAWANLRDQVELYRDANVPLHAEEAARPALRRDRRPHPRRDRRRGDHRGRGDGQARRARSRAPRARLPRHRRGPRGAPRRPRRLFLELVRLRERLAHNADLPDYRAFAWRAMHRHEYTPADALALHEAVAQELVPRLRAQRERRRVRMGLTRCAPGTCTSTRTGGRRSRPSPTSPSWRRAWRACSTRSTPSSAATSSCCATAGWTSSRARTRCPASATRATSRSRVAPTSTGAPWAPTTTC